MAPQHLLEGCPSCPEWGGGSCRSAPYTAPLPQVPASRQKGQGRLPVVHPKVCPVASGETPTEIEPQVQSPVLPRGRGTSAGRPPAGRVRRAAESDKPGSEDELCPHPYQARRLSEPHRAARSVLGTRLTELSWGAQPGRPRAPPSCPALGALSLPSSPAVPRPGPQHSGLPPSLSHAASPRLRPSHTPAPSQALSRAAQSLLPAPNLHPSGAWYFHPGTDWVEP